MKRQTQAIGVRDWYGMDFLSLQEEPLKVIDSFFSQYGTFVVSGCEVTANGSKYNVAPGLVALSGIGAEGGTVKIVVPFAGITATTLPVYLTLAYETENDVYHDGKVKPIINIYKAVATTVRPAGSYVQIAQSNVLRFVDVIQDAAHRFVSDAERTAWNKAIQDVVKYTPFDYIVDSNATLAGLNNNPNATCVLIKKGTWNISTSIVLHPNTKRIVGEPGNIIRSTGGESASFCYATKPAAAGYSIQGVNVVLTSAGGTGFYKMVNLSDCTCECAKISSQNEDNCFHSCSNLERCTAIIHENYHPADGYWACENLHQCRAQSDKANNYAIGMRRCKVVVECYSDCYIEDSYNVFMCQSTLYGASYYSSTAIATYKCADTLNGGWNKVITV